MQLIEIDKIINCQDVKVVYVRTAFVKLSLEEQNTLDIDFKIWKGEWNKALLGLYFALKDIVWFIPLKEAYQAENKYLQYKEAKELGFNLPKMIVSNVKDELIKFINRHNNQVVIKFMNQDFYKDSDNNFKGMYVNQIDIFRLNDFGNCNENPIVLQSYIEKHFEVRYVVVGKKHFVCRIESQKSNLTKIDWRRYDIPNTPHYSMEPPIQIKDKVSSLMKKLNLNYGALDFIVTKDGEWYFLEINTMGQFLWIEDLTGMPISNEIANWLSINNK